MNPLVLGVTAHVDAGKTTLCEALLYQSGAKDALGRVDHGDTLLDDHPIERERGITVFAHTARFTYGGTAFTLLDTPGHTDFAAETERTLPVLDAALLVISAAQGIMPHTRTLFSLLRRYHLPVFIFINKMDLAGADHDLRMAELRRAFGDRCVDFSAPAAVRDEMLAELREDWLEKFIAGEEIPTQEIAAAVQDCALIPCCFGSALKMQGTQALLDLLAALAPRKSYPADFSARVYKITYHGRERLTHLKITGGTLKPKDELPYQLPDGTSLTEKANMIYLLEGGTLHQQKEPLAAGSICAVTGLTAAAAGTSLGTAALAPKPLLRPALTYALVLPESVQAAEIYRKIRILADEDPTLEMLWDERAQEIRVRLMGPVALEILQRQLAERFGLTVEFSAGQIAYRETIAAPVEGVGHFEPLRHYAEVHLLLEPLERGAGLEFAADCPPDSLAVNWQRLVLTHLQEKTHIGTLTGAPITDMRITLKSGKAHTKHTEGGDFRQATYRAVRCGLRRAQSILLEPYMHLRLEVPAAQVGRAMTDLENAHADYTQTENDGTTAVFEGRAPVSCILHYAEEVTAYTRGQGQFTMTPDGYDECPDPEAAIAAIGYDCDGDVENTADSVFCSHGAGVVVPWTEVAQHMHLPSVFEKPPVQQESAPPPVQRSPYTGSIEQDKELLAIFERTYGQVRRQQPQQLHTVHEAADDPAPKKAAPNTGQGGAELLFVDGYNLIFAWETLNALAAQDFEAARHLLLERLCNYQGYRGAQVTVVFDAYRVKGHVCHEEDYKNIRVVYTQEGQTADAYIERAAYALSRTHRVRVVTSDGLEQAMILGSGALRTSAREFAAELAQTENEINRIAAKKQPGEGGKRIRRQEG